MKFNLCFWILFISGYALFAQHNEAIEKIVFTTLTRGAHAEIMITQDCVSITKQGRSDPNENNVKLKLKKEEWEKLINTLKHVSLNELSSYQSPSNKRAYDGAWHSSIIITTVDKKSFIHSFDDENPHEKLQPLMMVIHDLDKFSQDNR